MGHTLDARPDQAHKPDLEQVMLREQSGAAQAGRSVCSGPHAGSSCYGADLPSSITGRGVEVKHGRSSGFAMWSAAGFWYVVAWVFGLTLFAARPDQGATDTQLGGFYRDHSWCLS